MMGSPGMTERWRLAKEESDLAHVKNTLQAERERFDLNQFIWLCVCIATGGSLFYIGFTIGRTVL